VKSERIVLRGPFLQPKQVARNQDLSETTQQQIDEKVSKLFEKRVAKKGAALARRAKVASK
jgi:hypothetical protein